MEKSIPDASLSRPSPAARRRCFCRMPGMACPYLSGSLQAAKHFTLKGIEMRKSGFTLIELLVNTSQHNCFSLLLKSPQLP